MYTAVSEPPERRIAPGDPSRKETLMRNGSHRFWLCIAAAVAVSVIAVPAASAGVHKYDTRVRLGGAGSSRGHQYILGGVGPFQCWHGERVTVFKQRPGADRKLGHDGTGHTGDGLWDVRLPEGTLHAGDRVYAQVRRQLHWDERGNKYVCRADRSGTKTYPIP
jgi:hypothetical protein